MIKQTLWAAVAALPLMAHAQEATPPPSAPPAAEMAPAADAAPAKPGMYVGGLFSYNLPDTDSPAEAGYGGHVLFGFPLNSWLSLEANGFGHALVAGPGYTGTGSEFGLGVDARAIVYRDRDFSLFGIGGIGGGYMDLTPLGDETYYPFVNIGGGMLAPVPIVENLNFRAEARYYPLITNDTIPNRSVLHGAHFNVGFEYSFGRAAQEPVLPPPAPEPVKVVVEDHDGDGVVDAMDKCADTVPGTSVDATGCALPPPAPVDSDGDGVNDSLDKCPNTPKGLKVDDTGCVVQQTLVLHNINFATGSGELTADSKQILDTLADGMKGQSQMTVEIDGHTDSVGSQAYNLKLSKTRAAMVKQYLVEKGVAADRLTTDGFGEFKPVADNKTEAGRAQNRRVEFQIKN